MNTDYNLQSVEMRDGGAILCMRLKLYVIIAETISCRSLRHDWNKPLLLNEYVVDK